MEASKEFTKFVLRLVDRVHGYRVSAKLANTLANMRANFENKREANEEKRREHEEKLKREKEEKWAKMTPKER